MFRLLRVFSLTSALAILLVTAALVALYRQNAVRNLVETAQSENAGLARSFADTIWPRLSSYVGSGGDLDADTLRARAKTWRIRETAQVLSTGRPVLKVNIYTTSGFNVFSSRASEIGEDESGHPGFFTAARDGKPASRLVHKDTIEAFAGTLFHRDVVESYFPIRKGDGPIEGVIELYTDATPFTAMIDRTTVQLVGGLVLVLGLSYAVLFLVVRRAGRTLARQHANLQREVVERRRVEEDLRRSEALLRGAVDSLQEGFALFDAEDRLVLINDAYLDLNPAAQDIRDRGLRYEDLLRANIERGMIAEAIGREEDFIRERLERHRNPGDPILRRFTDGKWCLIKEARTPDGGTALTFTDVTKLKRAEEALLQAKRQNDMILEAAGEGIYGLDLEGRTTFINPAAAKMIGWEPEDLIGRPQHDILHHTRPDGTPYPRDECPIYAAFTDGQVHHVRDEVFWRKDGTSFPVEYVSTPIRVKGEILGAVIVFTDITERRKAEDALRVSEARLRDLVECTSDWIWHMDADLRFSYFSDRFEEVTGMRAEDLLGKTRRELGQGDIDDEKWRRHLAELEAHRPFRDFQYKFVHPDGRTLHFLVNGKPVFDEAGAFLGYRGVGSDITARVEAEEQARSARERLALAVDGLAEQFVLFDADDRIVLANAAWRELNRGMAEATAPGTRFEDFLRAAVEAGLMPDAVGREEEWLRWRLDLHRNPQGPFEIEREDGRWILINEQRLPDGGTVLIGTYITERKRAEEALRESEARFRAVIDNSPTKIHIKDLEGRYTLINRHSEILFGVTEEEARGKTSADIFPREVAESFKNHDQMVIETGEIIEEEEEWAREDGVHTYLTVKFPIPDATGKISAVGSIGTDITEHKRAAEALREAERRFRNLVDGSVQGILIHRDRRPLYVNRAWAEIHGYTVAEVMAMESVVPLIAPSERERMAEYRKRRMKGGDAPSWYEYEAVRKDGAHIWLENMTTVVTWKDEPAIQSTIVDVTERKRAKTVLEESEERIRLVIDNLHDGVITIDEDGIVQSFNPAAERIFGYAPDDVLGRNVNMLMPEPYKSEHDGYLARYEAGGKARIMGIGQEVEGLRNDGTTFPLELSVTEIRTGGRRMFIGIIRDITQRRQAEEQRLALEREVQQAGRMEAIGQLAGGIAHEINTPVQYIGDNLRFLDEAWRDLGPVVRKYRDLAESALGEGVLEDEARAVQSAAEEADLDYLLDELPKATRQSIEGTERVASIVLAMKDFSHPSAKEKVASDLNRAIQSTVTVSRNEWKHVAEVDLDLDEALAPVVCLAGEMNQVFLNLIVNAAHAIAAKGDGGKGDEGKGDEGKGRITVSTRKDGEWAEIRIADTGAGIPEEVQDKIFNPFFTTKEVGRGTGQGLAICRDIVVNKHGGKIFFDSKEGEGTTFVVRLPLDSGQSATEAA